MVRVEPVAGVQRKVHVARFAEVHGPVGDVRGELDEVNLLEFHRGGRGAVSIGGVPEAESEVHEVLEAEMLEGRALVERVPRALRAIGEVLETGGVDEQHHQKEVR